MSAINICHGYTILKQANSVTYFSWRRFATGQSISGDGSMVVNGIGDGVTSIGTGVLKGTESVVTGAT